jgi:mannitol/fructose-specific phosphotransferase system IIA component (Ntr-type)
MPTATTADIHQLLRPSTVQIGLDGTTKDEVIDALVDLLEGHDAIDSLGAVRDAVFEREKVMSTGVGKTLALPHAKTAAARSTVAAFATTAHPIDFGAIDNQPVRLVFLLVGPESDKSRHIKILGRISRLVSRDAVREQLLNVEAPKEVISILKEGEAELRA